ncbi:hypothetical protein [Streptomyces sp. NPDC053542]|uniref:hypothetical protein n=1 Tax=Streptomyces sp. NPDC053542 TaxID=3365710 RepID=UPI0037D30CFB
MGGGSRNAGAASGEDDTGGLSGLAERLGAAVRAGSAATPEGEERAVAAFRAARDARDTRAAAAVSPRRPWFTGRPVRAALGTLLASVLLGGVAVASIGTFGNAPERPGPSRTAPGHAVPPSGRPALPARPTVPLIRPPKPSPETTPETGAPGTHDHHDEPTPKPKPKPGQKHKQGQGQKPQPKPEKPSRSPKTPKPPKAHQENEKPLEPRQGKSRDQGQKAPKPPHKAKN